MAKIEKNKLIEKVKELEGLSNDEKAALIGYIKTKTYGLVWEDSTEKAWEQLKDYIPVLTEDKTKAIVNDTDEHKTPNHILIEGDNLLALTNLCFTHEGKVDVIYIDPPYNTGNKDFIYNDKFVDKDDEYKHSKWLSFMKKRLKIAKTLLSEKGVIFISIDDNEQANLKLLCDEVFGEKNRISLLPRITKSSGKTTDKIAQNHDYILFYAKNIEQVIVTGLPHDDEGFRYSDEYETSRGKYKLNQTLDYDSLSYSDGLDYPITIEGITLYPGGSYEKYLERKAGNHRRADWAWRWSPNLYDFGLKNGFIVLKKSKNGYRIYTKTYQYVSIVEDGDQYKVEYKERTKPIQSIDLIDNTYSNDNAKKELGKLFNPIPFDYPKPTSIMNTLLRIVPHSSTILDFFAGSGTTMHATMQLNAEDGGHRQCILVQGIEKDEDKNDLQIARKITYERNKRVIEGHTTPKGKYVEGLKDNNLRFFKVGFVPREKDTTNIERFARQSVNLLCIKEGVYKEQTMFGDLETDGFRYFKDGDKQFLVILEPDMIEPIIEELAKMDYEGKMPVYVFTTGHYPYTEDFWQVSEKVDLYPYPSCIYGACEKVMPKMEDKLLDLPDNVELSEEEANMTFEDLNKE